MALHERMCVLLSECSRPSAAAMLNWAVDVRKESMRSSNKSRFNLTPRADCGSLAIDGTSARRAFGRMEKVSPQFCQGCNGHNEVSTTSNGWRDRRPPC